MAFWGWRAELRTRATLRGRERPGSRQASRLAGCCKRSDIRLRGAGRCGQTDHKTLRPPPLSRGGRLTGARPAGEQGPKPLLTVFTTPWSSLFPQGTGAGYAHYRVRRASNDPASLSTLCPSPHDQDTRILLEESGQSASGHSGPLPDREKASSGVGFGWDAPAGKLRRPGQVVPQCPRPAPGGWDWAPDGARCNDCHGVSQPGIHGRSRKRGRPSPGHPGNGRWIHPLALSAAGTSAASGAHR